MPSFLFCPIEQELLCHIHKLLFLLFPTSFGFRSIAFCRYQRRKIRKLLLFLHQIKFFITFWLSCFCSLQCQQLVRIKLLFILFTYKWRKRELINITRIQSWRQFDIKEKLCFLLLFQFSYVFLVLFILYAQSLKIWLLKFLMLLFLMLVAQYLLFEFIISLLCDERL